MATIKKSSFFFSILVGLSTTTIALLNFYYHDQIQEQQQKQQQSLIMSLLQDMNLSVSPLDLKIEPFNKSLSSDINIYSITSIPGEQSIIVHAVIHNGYNGDIEFLLGFSQHQKTLPAIRVIRHQETPGLTDFLNDEADLVFDGVSAATITATALNESIQQIKSWVNKQYNI